MSVVCWCVNVMQDWGCVLVLSAELSLCHPHVNAVLTVLTSSHVYLAWLLHVQGGLLLLDLPTHTHLHAQKCLCSMHDHILICMSTQEKWRVLHRSRMAHIHTQFSESLWSGLRQVGRGSSLSFYLLKSKHERKRCFCWWYTEGYSAFLWPILWEILSLNDETITWNHPHRLLALLPYVTADTAAAWCPYILTPNWLVCCALLLLWFISALFN